jgi:predicted NUDIX family NTP pyrophosphohydrolase
MFRRRAEGVEVLLVHPGGPFWARKDDGAWTIPKGGSDAGEDRLATAQREFLEETGSAVQGAFIDLGAHRQSSGKTIVAWAVEGDLDADSIRSNSFEMEWPPHSGKTADFPEVDKAAWYSLGDANAKIIAGQRPILAALVGKLGLTPKSD